MKKVFLIFGLIFGIASFRAHGAGCDSNSTLPEREVCSVLQDEQTAELVKTAPAPAQAREQEDYEGFLFSGIFVSPQALSTAVLIVFLTQILEKCMYRTVPAALENNPAPVNHHINQNFVAPVAVGFGDAMLAAYGNVVQHQAIPNVDFRADQIPHAFVGGAGA